MLTLITGPVRSGKSAYAERLASSYGFPVTYVATARIDPTDAEMRDRVARHRAERPAGWATCEVWTAGEPDLARIVRSTPPDHVLLIDSLGTWLAGYLLDLETLAERDAPAALRELEALTAPLVPALRETVAAVVLVAEETGWGLVPPTPLGRIFRDHAGRMTKTLAQTADRVELIVAGYAIDLKAVGRPVG
jgi:adenosylcobinamide kinase/adenosylcobinamide-phosphate guanylyltransferase